jgi:hypothetical protein
LEPNKNMWSSDFGEYSEWVTISHIRDLDAFKMALGLPEGADFDGEERPLKAPVAQRETEPPCCSAA